MAKHWEFHPGVRTNNDRTLGEKAADAMRLGMGSWSFVFGFTGLMVAWAIYNSTARKPFDPFPFILLNLMLSGLAGLQGAILLIAAKRADRISAELAAYHLAVSESTKQMLADHKTLLEELRSRDVVASVADEEPNS